MLRSNAPQLGSRGFSVPVQRHSRRRHRPLRAPLGFAVLVGSISVTPFIASAQAADPSLVAAYAFDETSGVSTIDASGNGHTGTVTGALSRSTAGRFGGALVFNGSNTKVTIPDAPDLRLSTGATMEAWVKPAKASAKWRDIIYKGDDNYYLDATSSVGGVPAGGAQIGGSYREAHATSALPANVWAHVALTYDGSAVRLYVNALQVGSTSATGTILTSTNPLQIGGNSLYGQYFQGMIDEVRVYSVARTAAQLATDMSTSVTTPSDTTPPTAPAQLTATTAGPTEVTLTWTAASDDVGVTGYRVERCQNSGCTSFAELAAPATTSYSDTSAAASTTYQYRVRATDSAGNLSAYSNVATATTTAPAPDTVNPGPPGTLSVTSDASPSATLGWGPATDNVGIAGYRIDRCAGAGCQDFTHLVQLSGSGTMYTDTRVSNNTSYSYQVSALDAAGNIGPPSNQVTTVIPAPVTSLVAAYGFGETSGTSVLDGSGRGHTGTLGTATRTTSGKFGSALAFNGSSARVTIPDASDLRLTSAMTVEAWVNPSSGSASWADVVYKGDDNYYLEGSSTSAGAPVGGALIVGAHQESVGTAPLPANLWSHLALTYDSSAVRLFLNGNEVSSTAATGTIATSNNPVEIGGDSIYGQYFSGLIDEVRIYNTARTGLQIQSDMNTPVGGPSDTSPPTSPTNLNATAVSSARIDLAWQGSTDNVGVTGYQIERCQAPGCTVFDNIAASATPSFSDVSLAPMTSYSYRVRAFDSAGNTSGYSSIATASTGVGITPRVATLTPSLTQQFVMSGTSGPVTWSVDNVSGGNTTVGTISSTGLYTPPPTEGVHAISATAGAATATPATAYVTSYAGTLTHHNDVQRTGANLDEFVLTPSRVASSTFGKAFTYPTDGVSHASPLYVPDVSITGTGPRNVVFVATEHDSVYAFDADGRQSTPLWKRSFIDPAAGVTPVPALDTGECCDIQPEIGITGTPVIDQAAGTLYVVAKTKEVSGSSSSYVQRLHALNLSDGSERPGSPVVITASVPGSGNGSVGGTLPFDPLRENQRTGLLLRNGVVYIGFGSHGDHQPYHGWILGYDASTLNQTLAFCLTPNGEGAGVWQSGGAIASDSSGDLYFVSGDGSFDADTGGHDFGDTVMRLRATGAVADWFTPHDQQALDSANIDLGAGGVLLLPDQAGSHQHELVTAGKNGTIYLLDRDNMGHFNPSNDSQIVQSLPNVFPNGTPEPGNFSAPVYWNGFVYFSPVADSIQAFALNSGLLSTTATMRSATSYAFPGGSLAISANGGAGGILWAVQRTAATTNGILRAYDARNLGAQLNELWNSGQSGTRDALDVTAKYAIPLVANGRVYVSTVSTLTVYGLLG